MFWVWVEMIRIWAGMLWILVGMIRVQVETMRIQTGMFWVRVGRIQVLSSGNLSPSQDVLSLSWDDSSPTWDNSSLSWDDSGAELFLLFWAHPVDAEDDFTLHVLFVRYFNWIVISGYFGWHQSRLKHTFGTSPYRMEVRLVLRHLFDFRFISSTVYGRKERSVFTFGVEEEY